MAGTIDELLEKARTAEANGLLSTALMLYRSAYYKEPRCSAERRRRMADMHRLRSKGADGFIPGDPVDTPPTTRPS